LRSYLALALILPIFAIAPLCYPGYLETHSGFVPLWNLADARLNFGNLSWLPHSGLHFDPLRGDGLLLYALTAPLPFPPAIAIKIIVGLSGLLGSVGLFLALYPEFGDKGSLIAALIYTYLPYHLTTVYVRGAWGEALFWGLLPWVMVLWQPTTSKLLYLTCLVGMWLLLGLSQLGLALWAMGLATLLGGLTPHGRRAIVASWVGLALAIGWQFNAIPTISSPITDHLLYPAQLFSAQWGFGVSRLGWQDGLSLQIGFAAYGLALLNMTMPPRPTWSQNPRLFVLLGTALILTFLQLTWAAWLWQLPVIGSYLSATLSYPWQLMGFVGLSLAIIAGDAVRRDPQLTELPMLAALILFIILTVYPTLEPQFIATNKIATQATAILGDNQIALIQPEFRVNINGHTAGLITGKSNVPLAIHGALHANDTLNIQLTWQAIQPLTQDWKLFIHLVNAQEQVIAQFDGYAENKQGEPYPTSHWISGELINNEYSLTLPAEMPSPPYRLFIGFYDENNFVRLPVHGDTNGRVILNIE
jgi:hypothetical protein